MENLKKAVEYLKLEEDRLISINETCIKDGNTGGMGELFEVYQKIRTQRINLETLIRELD